jgi:hypothetical protein
MYKSLLTSLSKREESSAIEYLPVPHFEKGGLGGISGVVMFMIPVIKRTKYKC